MQTEGEVAGADPQEREHFVTSVVLRMADMAGTLMEPEELRSTFAMVSLMLAEDLVPMLPETGQPDAEAVAMALVDLKHRIGGHFDIESIDDTRIVLIGRKCPFGHGIGGRSVLCQVTEGLFTRVAKDMGCEAEATVERSFACGDDHCRVVLSLDRLPSGAASGAV